ncbi:MAG TPA: SWIB/MDM2 domain-containing protein [Elusimicrobiales bacterium]|jgi:chromatin remodeling complex protein RSC6|nr:SWIB/MDM2 domain-containing protein [Acidobacteriota bacterium]MDQ7774024.1 SWIB/MDM2 domain-containing protein [Elusimicrobiales bacterium]HNT97007.1 SWIB/MDM2 domain-containing protein [Elusimicrobiales bacterium]HOI41480.1 SWIB/MDM2 domain-containing protein [Elusimicrobiales bacterium]
MPAAKANSKFMAPITPNETLGAVVGNKPMPRTEIVKKLWAYIKKNNLQDKKNKRCINADEKLLKLFAGKKQVTMFDLAKIIGKNAK